LWQWLRSTADSNQRLVLETLHDWAAATEHAPTRRALSLEELRSLDDSGLIEIGAHSLTHPLLPGLTTEAQQWEIQRSKASLEEALGHRVTSFAYPYGAYEPATLAIVQRSGFDRACTTVPGVVGPDTGKFEMPRFMVQDWDGEEFCQRLMAWIA
jgi:peptidoglycan/xylan/chitin deacetylase (PgdA/CDA1 family)